MSKVLTLPSWDVLGVAQGPMAGVPRPWHFPGWKRPTPLRAFPFASAPASVGFLRSPAQVSTLPRRQTSRRRSCHTTRIARPLRTEEAGPCCRVGETLSHGHSLSSVCCWGASWPRTEAEMGVMSPRARDHHGSRERQGSARPPSPRRRPGPADSSAWTSGRRDRARTDVCAVQPPRW